MSHATVYRRFVTFYISAFEIFLLTYLYAVASPCCSPVFAVQYRLLMLCSIDRWRCNRKCDASMCDVIRADPDFRSVIPSASTTSRFDDCEEDEENHHHRRRPSRSQLDDDVIGHRNRKWKSSAMRRTSTARSSLQLCAARVVPEVSDIRPEVDEAGTMLADDSSVSDVDDLFSMTEFQPGAAYLPTSK